MVTGNGYVLFNGPHTATASTDTSPGVAGNYLSVASGAFTQPPGDMTVAVRIAVGDADPTVLGTIIGKYDTTGNQRSWELRHETTGAFSLQWSSNGTSVVSTTGGIATSSVTLSWLKPTEWFWLAVTMDSNDGAGGSDVRFWTSRQDVEVMDLVTDWTQLGSTQHAAYTTGFFASTAPLTIGAAAVGTGRPWKGRVKSVSVRTGVSAPGNPGGVEVVGFDTTDIPADGATSFVAGTGHTVTVNRSGAATDDVMTVPNTSPGYVQFLDGFFPIGVDLQDATSSTIRNTWNTRGINTFVRSNASISVDPTAWSNAVEADGRFKQIRHPKATTSGGSFTAITEASIPSSLIAYSNRDEPEGVGSQITYQVIAANQATIKAALPGAMVMGGFAGSMNQNDVRYWPSNDPDGESSANEPWMRKYLNAVDYIAGFRYPVNTGAAMSALVDSLNRLQKWQVVEWTQPLFHYIEASDYDTTDGNPAPTAAQVRGEVWAAICMGVRGIFYFPERVTPSFSADATPADVQAEMPLISARIGLIAEELQGPIDPSTCAVTCSNTALMRTWRTSLTHHVFVVHNFTASAVNGVTVQLHGTGAITTAEVVGESRSETLVSGAFTDDFPAYTSHVYKVAIDAPPDPYVPVVVTEGGTYPTGTPGGSGWTLHVADARTGARLGEVPLAALDFEDNLNDSGAFSFRVAPPATATHARYLLGILQEGRVTLAPVRNGIPVGFTGWLPPGGARCPDYAGAGLLSYFDRRHLFTAKTYLAVDQFALIRDLVDSTLNYGILLDTTLNGVSGVPRDQSWALSDAKNIGEAIRQKAALANGFDFDMLTEGDFVRRLRLWYPRRGRPYIDQQSPVFTVGGNVPTAPAPIGDELFITQVTALGEEIDSVTQARLFAYSTRWDLITGAGYPVIQQHLDMSDVSVQATLQAHVDGYAVAHGQASQSEIIFRVDPNDGTWPWGSWELGSDCRLVIPADVDWRYPDLFSEIRRVTGHRWVVDDQGEALYVKTSRPKGVS